MAISVRELPPLRLSWNAVTPAGKSYRWGEDERDANNIPGGVSFSSTMPGGFEQASVTLPRKSGVDFSDLERLTTLTAYGPGGDVAWEGRLERAPRVSGNEMAVSPAAVGWQAHLEDDKSAREIYVDRDLSRWGEGTVARHAQLAAAGYLRTWSQTTNGGEGGLVASIARINSTAAPLRDISEFWYDSGGIPLQYVYYVLNGTGGAGAGWVTQALLSDDELTAGADVGTNHTNTGPVAAYQTVTAQTRTFITLQGYYNSVFTGDGQWSTGWSDVAVYGYNGVPGATGPNPVGYYASGIVRHAVGKWAPLLTADVQDSSFVIDHMAFHDPTTAGEIVRQATRFGLQDWAVWENKTFVWHNRGERGRSWRARISPSQLEETGKSIERLYESVMVQYRDVDGSTRTVGPPGSGANTEDAALKDDDPQNPANQLGIVRRELLQMGTSTAAGATEIGRRFLEEQKLLDTSGRAVLVGHVEDDHGVLHPAWRVRAGDTITFVDASDPSPRRIVKASYDHGSRTCSVDLDAPPEGLKALLERLGVVLVPLGFG